MEFYNMQLHDLGICMQCAWGIYHNIGVNAKILRLSGRLVENVQLYIYIYIVLLVPYMRQCCFMFKLGIAVHVHGYINPN